MAENHLQFIQEGRSWKDLVDKMTGAGYGTWRDSQYTVSNKRVIPAETRTQLTIDGLHPSTYIGELNTLSPALWSNNTIYPENLGDSYSARLNLSLERASNSSGQYATFEMDIGTPGSPIPVLTVREPLLRASGVTQFVTLSDVIFSLDTFVANGAKIYITSTEQISIWDTSIFLRRDYISKGNL